MSTERNEYHRDYMRRWRAGEVTVKVNGQSHLIDELDPF